MQYRIIGFTGTREGLTEQQVETLKMLLETYGKGTIFHHGCCEGADKEANSLANWFEFRVVEHPGHASGKKTCTIDPSPLSSATWLPKFYLKRNQDIVDCCQILIATPKGYEEEQRSGTWATIRYAVNVRKEVTVIWPDGKYESIVTLPLTVNREVKELSRKVK